ncbi:MAG TPA: 2-hydroxychromene-2-carboxylate isomerase [Rhodobacteraceae bacterium]|jgi:2-hydroxychromene-2-carboxylate isomerase|nr:2-hydroxychromene-2-carboxylate isomerase [Rhodobacter sp.]HBN31619.1 2-hydroxychromene-2-carboxylate isomerase [Paracoccaceae bacterium]
MAHIDYYTSPISTFAYLAGNRFEQVVAKHKATVTYKPFDLVANFNRTGGLPLGQRHESRVAYRLQELERISKRYGLPMNFKPAHFPTNPAPASYAIIAAQNAGGGDLGGLVQAFLCACFEQEKDVADDLVIRACLTANGFDPTLADSGMMAGAETYARNTEDAVRLGVFGAPFYIVGEEKFWGQDRIEYLDAHLDEIG